MDNIGVTSIYFGRYYNDTESRINEKDITVLLDSNVYPEKPKQFLDFGNYIVISHEKYLKHQQELDRIIKIEGDKSDSLNIGIEYYNEKKERKYYSINKKEQILEYTEIIRLLLNVDGFLPFDGYKKNNK
ncbi:MAG: hypothetical protein HZB41_00490 [Ignavibacteriae bacterium]|nr:hypothetical protein [Ignavibacteriota bacterium]